MKKYDDDIYYHVNNVMGRWNKNKFGSKSGICAMVDYKVIEENVLNLTKWHSQ